MLLAHTSNSYAMAARLQLFSLLSCFLQLFGSLYGQHLLMPQPVRAQRSLYGPGPFGSNTIGGISPVGLGQMSKDELLTLLEAWHEVEGHSSSPSTKPKEAEQMESDKPAPMHEVPPATSGGGGDQGAAVAGRQPLTVRLPAFVPVQLSAMYTLPLPAGGGNAAEFSAGIPAEAAPRLFRFMQLPVALPPSMQPQSAPAQGFVVRNTLDSIDADTSPQGSRIKVTPKPKSLPLPAPKDSPITRTAPPAIASRPRYVMPELSGAPFLGHAPGQLELVPSTQLLSNWQ